MFFHEFGPCFWAPINLFRIAEAFLPKSQAVAYLPDRMKAVSLDCSRSFGDIFKKRDTNPLSTDSVVDNSLSSIFRV